MPGGNVRVGGAYFAITADASGYAAGANRAIAANQRLGASYGRIANRLQATQIASQSFAASLRTSLLATAAYVGGAGAVAAGLRGIVGGFLEYDRGLIKISKTTGIVGGQLERLGEQIEGIGIDPEGARRAIDVTRADLFSIAEAVGQAGISSAEGLERVTRAAAALQSSSNLIGSNAVRAITRYLQVTGQSVDRTDAFASAITHLGNNIVGTESEISQYAVRVAQNLSAVGKASDAVILGLSSTLLEAGIEMEAAGTALQRAQIAILRAAGDPAQFNALRAALGGTREEVDALRGRFLAGIASAEDYDRALLALLTTFRNLPDAERQGFLAEFIGGGESNVRVLRTVAALANREERLRRNVRLANEGLESQEEHFKEAADAADAYEARLDVVGKALQRQATDVGELVGPAIAGLAEQYEYAQVAAAGLASAFAVGAVRRRVTRFREQAAAAREVATEERNVANAARFTAVARARAARIDAVAATTDRQRTVAQNRRTTALQQGEAARIRAANASAILTRQTTLATRAAAAARGAFSFLGGGLGLLTLAITAGATAWGIWGNSVDEAAQHTENLVERLNEATDRIRNQAQTAEGNLLVSTRTELTRLILRMGEIEERLADARALQLSPFASELGLGPDVSIGSLESELATLQERYDTLTAAVTAFQEAAGVQSPDDLAAAIANAQFERLPASVLPAIQAVEAFRNSMEDAARADLASARAQQYAATLSGNAAREALAIEDERARIAAYRLDLERQLNVNRQTAADTALRAEVLRDELADQDLLPFGSDARKEAERALAAEEKKLETLKDQAAVRREELRLAAGLTPPEDLIRESVRRNRAAEIRRTLQEPAQGAALPPRFRVQTGQEEIDIERRLSEVRRRTVLDQVARTAASNREEAAIRARASVIDEYIGREREAREALEATESQLAAVTEARRRAQTSLELHTLFGREVTEQEQRQFEALRDHERALQDQRAELELTAAGLHNAAAGYSRLAEAQAELARQQAAGPLERMAADAGRLQDQLEEVAARGINSLADSLTRLVTEGKADFRDLANSIIADLTRIILQTQVLAPLAGFLPGLIGSFFSGTPPGLGPGINRGFHTGGVAPHAPQRLQRRTGLRSDELFAVLQRGEMVLPRDLARRVRRGDEYDMDALRRWVQTLPRFHSGGVAGGGAFGAAAGGSGGVTVNIHNESRSPVEVPADGVLFDPSRAVLDVVIRDARQNGPGLKAIRSGLRAG